MQDQTAQDSVIDTSIYNQYTVTRIQWILNILILDLSRSNFLILLHHSIFVPHHVLLRMIQKLFIN